jgi:hypothetical protein
MGKIKAFPAVFHRETNSLRLYGRNRVGDATSFPLSVAFSSSELGNEELLDPDWIHFLLTPVDM